MNDHSNATLTQLINTYDVELQRVLLRRCGCIETVADILQETYQRILLDNLWQKAENPRALLHRIAANLATDYERRRAVRNKYISSNEEATTEHIAHYEGLQPEHILATHERLDRLLLAVEKLPPKCRTVFILRKVEDLSQADIAKRLGISRNMVEKHLRNALKMLQDASNE